MILGATDFFLPQGGTQYFKIAREQSMKSSFRCRVGACLVIGKSISKGFNKRKTHPVYANPNKHVKTSIHAELDCLINYKHGDLSDASIFVWRETADGRPAMSRPCEHCLGFLKEKNIKTIYYTIPNFPYWKKETL